MLCMALLISAVPSGAEPLTDDTDMETFLYDTFTLEDADPVETIPAENGAWTLVSNKDWWWMKAAISNGAFVFGKGGQPFHYYGASATRTIVPPTEVDTSSKRYVIKFDMLFDIPDTYNGNENPGYANITVNGKVSGKDQPAAQLAYIGSGDTKGKLLVVTNGGNTVLLEEFDPTASYEIKIELDFNTGLSTYTIGETRKTLAMAYSDAGAFSGEISSFVLDIPRTDKTISHYERLTLDNLRVGMAIKQDTSSLVAEDLAALSLGDGSAVEHSFVLPSLGSVHDSAITWTSTHEGIAITNVRGESNQYQACVTRPAASAGDISGQLTATVTNGDVSDTRSFDVTVKALEEAPGYFEDIIDDTFSGEYLNPTAAELSNGVTVSGIDYVPVELDNWLFSSIYKRTAGQHGFRIHEDGYLQLGHNVADDCGVEAVRTIRLPERPMASVSFRTQFAPTIPDGSEATHNMQMDYTLGMPKSDGSKGNITLRYTASERSVIVLNGNGTPILTNVDSAAWYAFRIDLNYIRHTFDVYVNGEKRATQTLNPEFQMPDCFSASMQRFKNPDNANYLIQGLIGIDDFTVSAVKSDAAADMILLGELDGFETADYLSLPKTGECSGGNITWSCEAEGLLSFKEIDDAVYGIWDKSKLTGDTEQVTLHAVSGDQSGNVTITVQNRQGIPYGIHVNNETVRAIRMEEQAAAADLFVAGYTNGRLVSVSKAQTQETAVGEFAATLPVPAECDSMRAFLWKAGVLTPLGNAW